MVSTQVERLNPSYENVRVLGLSIPGYVHQDPTKKLINVVATKVATHLAIAGISITMEGAKNLANFAYEYFFPPASKEKEKESEWTTDNNFVSFKELMIKFTELIEQTSSLEDINEDRFSRIIAEYMMIIHTTEKVLR